MMTAAALAVALGHIVIAGRVVEARQPADVAAKLSGSWVFNRELSTGFGPAGPGRGRGGPPSLKLRRPGAMFAIAPGAQGRRGGGGGGADQTDLTPEQRAEQAAMRQLQQIETRITIKASPAEVTFTDSRGEQTFAINDKAATIIVASSPLKVKVKWDKQALKQEFSNSQAKLVQTWSLDSADHLVMTAKVESLTLVTPERKAVFDRR
jgi:hypothetical protein